jgi:transcriptional regulator with XRE-family HTH domain
MIVFEREVFIMDFGKKIMSLRKKSGLSQEKLAFKVGVARQTISKWELGETSPDLKQAKVLSKIFNVSLDELVDNDIKNVLVEKTSNTEKLAGLILKLIKFMLFFVIAMPILLFVLRIVFKSIHRSNSGRLMNVSIKCNLHNEVYGYEFNYFENTGEIIESGGDGYLINITGSHFSDVYQALDVIDFYVKNNGGTCDISEAKEI